MILNDITLKNSLFIFWHIMISPIKSIKYTYIKPLVLTIKQK